MQVQVSPADGSIPGITNSSLVLIAYILVITNCVTGGYVDVIWHIPLDTLYIYSYSSNRAKAGVYGRSVAETAGLNPTECVDYVPCER